VVWDRPSCSLLARCVRRLCVGLRQSLPVAVVSAFSLYVSLSLRLQDRHCQLDRPDSQSVASNEDVGSILTSSSRVIVGTHPACYPHETTTFCANNPTAPVTSIGRRYSHVSLAQAARPKAGWLTPLYLDHSYTPPIPLDRRRSTQR